MSVNFSTRKDGGRVVTLEHGEDFCINCGLKRGDKRCEWYFFTGLPRGLYCFNCASDPSIKLTILNEDSIFWVVDEWEYVVIAGKKEKMVRKNGTTRNRSIKR